MYGSTPDRMCHFGSLWSCTCVCTCSFSALHPPFTPYIGSAAHATAHAQPCMRCAASCVCASTQGHTCGITHVTASHTQGHNTHTHTSTHAHTNRPSGQHCCPTSGSNLLWDAAGIPLDVRKVQLRTLHSYKPYAQLATPYQRWGGGIAAVAIEPAEAWPCRPWQAVWPRPLCKSTHRPFTPCPPLKPWPHPWRRRRRPRGRAGGMPSS